MEHEKAAGDGSLKLYQFAASGNSRTVRIVLAEKGLSFARVNIDVIRGENREPEFLRLNPRGKVPVLVHTTPAGQVVLSESSVINEYLDEAFPEPRLMPDTPAARAQVRALVHLYDTELSPATGLLIIEKLLKPPAEQRADFVAERLQRTREILSRVTEMSDQTGSYLTGAYSLADALYTPVLSVMAPCGIVLGQEFPRLGRWLEAVKARPSYAASEQ